MTYAAAVSLSMYTMVQFFPASIPGNEMMACNSRAYVGLPYENGNGPYVITDYCIFTLVPALNGEKAPSFSVLSSWTAPGNSGYFMATCGPRPDGRTSVCFNNTPSPGTADLMTWRFFPGLSNSSMWSLQNADNDEYLMFSGDQPVQACGHGHWDVVTSSSAIVPSPDAATWGLSFFAPQPVMGGTYALTQAAAPHTPLRVCELTAVVCMSDCATANTTDYLFQVVPAVDGSDAPFVSFSSIAHPGYFLLPQYDSVAPTPTVVVVAELAPSLRSYATWHLYTSRVDRSGWALYSPTLLGWMGPFDPWLSSCTALAPVNDVAVFSVTSPAIWTLSPVEVSASPSPSAAAAPAVTPSGQPSSSHGALPPLIVGVTVLVVAVLLVVILGAMLWRQRRAQRNNGKVVPAPKIALTNFASLRINSSSADVRGDGLDVLHSNVRPLLGKLDRRHSFG